MNGTPEIVVTDENLDRLYRVIEQNSFAKDPEAMEFLEGELGRAVVVTPEEVPDDVVTMNSRVLYEDLDTGAQRMVQLVYPHEVGGDSSRISILAPVGIALLGLRAGQQIRFPIASGRIRSLRVLKVVFQPEADLPQPPFAA